MNNPCVLCGGDVLYPDGINLRKTRKHRAGQAHKSCCAATWERARLARIATQARQEQAAQEHYLYLTGHGVPACEAAHLSGLPADTSYVGHYSQAIATRFTQARG